MQMVSAEQWLEGPAQNHMCNRRRQQHSEGIARLGKAHKVTYVLFQGENYF